MSLSFNLDGHLRARISQLKEHIEVTEQDRDVKWEEHDHHGVRDATVDIETKLARVDELNKLLELVRTHGQHS